jgi:subfamily B ATP-binding cassette protein MsbA
MALGAASTAGLAKQMEPIIDDVFKSESIEALKYVSLVVFVLFIVKGFSAYGESIFMNFIGQRIIANLQRDLFECLLKSDLAFFHHTSTGTLISRCTNDVNLMRNVVSNTITSFGKDSFTVFCLMIVMFYQDWFLSSIAFFVFPVAILPIVKIGKRMRKVSTSTQKETGSYMTLLNEIFQGARLVKAYGMEKYENSRAKKIIEEIFRLNIKSNRIKSMSSPIMETLGGMAIVVVISYGGLQVIKGNNSAGAFFSFISALLLAYEPMKNLAKLNANLQEGLAATIRVFDVIDAKPKIINLKNAKELQINQGTIEFKKVNFSYNPEKQILKNINLKIPAGKTIALVGPSGSGKSTLLNLIPRFYEANNGEILFDNHEIKSVTIDSLRKNIALVSQEIMLFDDTIMGNILYGNPHASKEDVYKAAKAAAAHSFIQKLPQGYDTRIGESGIRLSGGQRQRISIARAMLKNAPILLLDEATSSLDTESERQVQKALEKLIVGRTCIIIAHRLSTVKDANKIYVLDQGTIAEQGTHSQLLKKKGIYSELCKWQLIDDKENSKK